jgi:hypothetical protein
MRMDYSRNIKAKVSNLKKKVTESIKNIENFYTMETL